MASTFDPAMPVAITADEIAWFRTARAAWDSGESGAPGIVPPGLIVNTYVWSLLSYPPSQPTEPAARRLEPIVLAAFLNARFEPGSYRLDPPVDPAESWDAGTPRPAQIEVRPEHITLLRRSVWGGSFMNDKRPYGDLTYYEADMALALGHTPPLDANGVYDMPASDDLHYQALHHELLDVVQAYIQHAAFEPGAYVLPRDGWSAVIRPRCARLPPAQAAAYQAFCAANPPPGSRHLSQRALIEIAVGHFTAKLQLFAAPR